MFLKFDIEPENIVAVGDIHGEFKLLINKANDQYRLKNTIIIQCGDFGIGFYKENFYKTLFTQLNKKLKKNNNILVVLRGNHDNPKYFDDSLNLSNLKLVADYSIIKTPTKCCLLIGGAISIDRINRKHQIDYSYSYWHNESFVYDENKLNEINNLYNKQITHVFTHSCPEGCEPYTKDGIKWWMNIDKELKTDVDLERSEHKRLMDYLSVNKQPIRQWFYGHFHYSKQEFINGIQFVLLDIEQFQEIR